MPNRLHEMYVAAEALLRDVTAEMTRRKPMAGEAEKAAWKRLYDEMANVTLRLAEFDHIDGEVEPPLDDD